MSKLYYATVQVLVEANDHDEATSLIEQKLMNGDCVIDAAVDSVETCASELEDRVVNGVYETGEAFMNWVAFSATMAHNMENSGYWSSEHGWESKDLATNLRPIEHCFNDDPGDVVLMLR